MMASAIAMIQDAGDKKDIIGSKNTQFNGDADYDTNSRNKDEKVDKTENNNVRNMCTWKDTHQKVTMKEKRGKTDLHFELFRDAV